MGLIDYYDNADENLKIFLFVGRRRPAVNPINGNDNVIQ